MLSEKTLVLSTCKCGYEFYNYEITDFWDTKKEFITVEHTECYYCQHGLESPKNFIKAPKLETKNEKESTSTGS